MSEELKYLMPTRVGTIQARLTIMSWYIPEPKTGTNALANYHYFDDKIFPLTNPAIEQYKKLVKVRASRLAQNLNDTRDQMDVRKMQDSPKGELLFRHEGNIQEGKSCKEVIKKLLYREWFTIGAARALCNMLGVSAGYIFWLNKHPQATRNQRFEQIDNISNTWDRYYVEFESCLAQINIISRAQSGYSTAQKKKTIKAWALQKAHEICKTKNIHSKKELADIIFRDHYRPYHWNTPLKTDNELNTIYRWLINDTTIKTHKNSC